MTEGIYLYHANLFHTPSRPDTQDASTELAATHRPKADSVSAARARGTIEDSALDGEGCGASTKSSREEASPKKGETMNPEKQLKHQRGYIFKSGKWWYGRFYRDELETQPDGSKLVVRRQRAEKLCERSDRYRSEKDVRPLLEEKLRPLNDSCATAESTLSVTEYIFPANFAIGAY